MAVSKKIKDLMKEFNIPFPPSKTEGERKGKKWVTWEAEADDGLSKFEALYSVWRKATVADRKRIEETYEITGLTLQRKVGVQPDQKVARSGDSRMQKQENIRNFSSAVNKELLKDKLATRLAELDEETKSVKAQLKQIESIDDEMLQTILDLAKM